VEAARTGSGYPILFPVERDWLLAWNLLRIMDIPMNSTNDTSSLTRDAVHVRLMDLFVLTKLELTGLSVLTALCGFYVGAPAVQVMKLFWTGVGTWLLGAAAGALNQYQERLYDGMMRRTERRPLPAGRMSPLSALSLGMGLVVAGAWILYELANPLAMALGLATVGFYILVYTPMKRRTPLATAVGAVPGAMPPLIGWAAAQGHLEAGAFLLFGLVYLWQLPHFLAIAWMYQKDYMRAGFKVLSVSDARGTQTGAVVLASAALLLPETLLFYFTGLAGLSYIVIVAVAGGMFLAEAWRFFRAVSKADGSWPGNSNAVSRRLFFASLVYLPVVMFLLALAKQ
jgi:heme o synthase